MENIEQILEKFAAVAGDPLAYGRAWQKNNSRPVVGILPMNFPAELAHAAGALPMVLQDDDEPITQGQSRIFSFYCGYNRSLVNQTMNDRFQFLDAILLGDHCVQVLGTADTMRNHMPDVPVLYDQLVSTINAPWAASESRRALNFIKDQLEDILAVNISDERIRASIAVFNKNRQLQRTLYDLRAAASIQLSAVAMQHIVKASMIMDRDEHSNLLESLLSQLTASDMPANVIKLYLSGHMCHAPKPKILSLIEDCGAVVIGDDLFTGFRYISTDVSEQGDSLDALIEWYLERNKKVPCPTRSARDYDWDEYLVDAVTACGAEGVIILLVKFCEPHMYYYPDIKDRFDKEGIPYLLVETEHEEIPIEALKTRLETFVEIAASKARRVAG